MTKVVEKLVENVKVELEQNENDNKVIFVLSVEPTTSDKLTRILAYELYKRIAFAIGDYIEKEIFDYTTDKLFEKCDINTLILLDADEANYDDYNVYAVLYDEEKKEERERITFAHVYDASNYEDENKLYVTFYKNAFTESDIDEVKRLVKEFVESYIDENIDEVIEDVEREFDE